MKNISTLFVLLYLFVNCCEVTSHRCYMKRCLSCSEDMLKDVGVSVECRQDNWMSAEWLHNLGYQPPISASPLQLEYRCLKMIATPDDKTWGRTTDLLRGCVPLVQVDSVCAALVSVERARGHSDARCFVCRNNDCNAATNITGQVLMLILSVLLFVFIW